MTSRFHKHLFVSGPSRCGTTMLRLVLSSHPDITITPEARFITSIFCALPYLPYPTKRLNQQEVMYFLELLRAEKKLKAWPGLNTERLCNDMLAAHMPTMPELLDKIFVGFAKAVNGGDAIVGNKKGAYALGYGSLYKQMFPDAKFIFIVRDPRDAIASILKNVDASFRYALSTYFTRFAYIYSMCTHYAQDSLVVRYEDVVNNPKKICERICSFLEVTFHEKMIDFYKNNKDYRLLSSAGSRHHPHTNGPFDATRIGQWESDQSLTNDQIATIEKIGKKYMAQWGYALSAQVKRYSFNTDICKYYVDLCGRKAVTHALHRRWQKQIKKG
ncbi:MAG: sulfotransferase [Candidatus Omnitrophica bacterium]|nr:sulfotransferase [Candidatus Omnitrophota bacterium]